MKTNVVTRYALYVRLRRHRGFALIVTLLLMSLLLILCLGLLSLSTISLRASESGRARATAQANARMALMLAIGELQKNAGPDQRVTARADILDENIANPRLTGVWKSWQIQADKPPGSAEYEESARNQKFLGWLASSPNGTSQEDVSFAKQQASDPITLWGEGSLGKNATGKDIVTASRVGLGSGNGSSNNANKGAFAWAVMDEGVKVRINTPYVDDAASNAMKTAQLGSGVLPLTASINNDLSKLKPSYFKKGSDEFVTLDKGISRLNFGYATESLQAVTQDALKPLTHDVTTQSVGLFTDIAAGGLKEDFNLLANAASLPSAYAGQGVYKSRLGITGPSDPRWESLQQLAQLYKQTSKLTNVNGVPNLKSSIPSGWSAATGSSAGTGAPGITNRTPPAGVVLMPTIEKVQIVFSLLTRDIYNYPFVSDSALKPTQTEAEEKAAMLHDPYGGSLAGSSFDYMLHLLYTPIITVHNPYNVALEFSELKVLFGNVPFGIQVFRTGVKQTNDLAPLDTLYYQDAEKGLIPKRFGMTLKNNGGSAFVPAPGSSTFRLLPGEVVMFSPYIPPNHTWYEDRRNGGTKYFSDWAPGTDRTLTMEGMPGWRGDGIGFDLDWFCPSYNSLRVSDAETENGRTFGRGGTIPARATDVFSVKFAPISVPGLSNNKFIIEVFAKPVDSNQSVSSGLIEMDYQSPTGLRDSLLGPNGTITYPKDGKTIKTMDMHSHALTPIKNIKTTKPFAMVTAQAKTTLGGKNADGEDGKFATKPWSFGHAVAGVSSQKVVRDHPANNSHEFYIQRLENGTNNLLQFDSSGRGYSITGETSNTGRKFGALYDIPLGPLQSLAQLNAANPGGSSGYLPRFAQPIGNSWAHPMMNPGNLNEAHADGALLDHSFLLNLALYDRFYFSGLADQTGNFGSGRDVKQIATGFVSGTPLTDPRLTFHAPDGRAESVLTDGLTATDLYTRIAGWQLVNGPFNINSTSVAAWKAMLGSVHGDKAIYNNIDKVGKKSTFADLAPVDASKNESRISRFRFPASQSKSDGGDVTESYWLGPREYSEAEMQTLAESIVKQVRLRGPFLSMAEFVNRRLGDGDNAQRGALQQAIDNSGLNQKLAEDSEAGYEIPTTMVSGYAYKNVAAGAGSSYQGAPGYLSQADLLTVLGNAATARSDTFTIRAYGEARDSSNKRIASAICEAVVQRLPEYVDSADKVETQPAALSSTANKNFGRRFEIVSFRWLHQDEI